MILDTSFLIDLFDGREDAFQKGLELSDAGMVQRIPSPVVTELSYGSSFDDQEERRKVRNALRMYPVVEQDETTAQHAGELLACADKDGGGESGVGKVDAMIGAVGDIYDEPVLTNNTDDFEALGVEVESY